MTETSTSPWYTAQPELATLVRQQRTEGGASYRDLAGLLFEKGIHVPVDSLRRIFSEQGWNKERSQADVIDYQKSRVGILQDRARLREEVDSTGRWRYFVDALERATQAHTPVEKPFDPADTMQPFGPLVIMMPLLGDVHTAQWMRKEEVGARLAFDALDFERRMTRWSDGVINHINYTQQFSYVSHVAIAGLGDYVENAQMRDGAGRLTYETTAESVVNFCEHFLTAVERLFAAYPHLTFSIDFVNGNHDRIGRKGEEHPWESYGTIIAAYVKRALKLYEPRITVTGHPGQSVNLQIGANHVLITHGQQAQGGTVPFAAIEKLSERLAGFNRAQHQFMVVGHYHHGATWTANNGVECILNPAFADTSSFSAGSGLVSTAGQKVLTFLTEGGLYSDHTIRLSEPLRPVTPHVRGAA